jgi:hypothetical protein
MYEAHSPKFESRDIPDSETNEIYWRLRKNLF